MTTVKLPRASIGAYGALLRGRDDEAVAAAFLQHTKDIDRLQSELAAAIARRDVAFTVVQERGRRGGQR